jgi:RNA polymerase sigma factor (sigma-70 family)
MELVIKCQKATNVDDRTKEVGLLIELIGPELQAYCLRCCRPQIAADVFQESLIKIASKVCTFRGSSERAFRAWCYTILRRRIWDAVKKLGRRELEPFDNEELWNVISAGGAEIAPGTRLDLEYAMSLLDKGKVPCRALLWTYHILGWDYALIAKATKRTYDNVRVALARCLKLAQTLIAKHS